MSSFFEEKTLKIEEILKKNHNCCKKTTEYIVK